MTLRFWQEYLLGKYAFLTAFLLVTLPFPVSAAFGVETEGIIGLRAFHRSGQTFLIWNAAGFESVSQGDEGAEVGIPQSEYKRKHEALGKAEKEGRKIRYHVYRSGRPIDTDSLGRAQRLAEVAPLSAYYPLHLGTYWHSDQYKAELIPRLAVEPGRFLRRGEELYVHTAKEAGKFFYAILVATNGRENRSLSEENSLKEGMDEAVGEPEPVLQRTRRLGRDEHYLYQKGPGEIRYYMTWADEPYSNLPRCYEWSVAVPEAYHRSDKKAALQLSLHAWGGRGDSGTFWYKMEPYTIRISTVNYPPQDWWYGYRRDYQASKKENSPTIFNYTERRLTNFMEWMKRNWRINDHLLFVEGSSMGGSGAMSFGMKNGDTFCYADSWVGIACWRHNDHFRKGEREKWGEIGELMNYNGVKFDDWMDLSWWLRKYPQKETPFLSFSNGKNDTGIGWYQAVLAVQALWETKRPFVFVWGMGGHSERSRFKMDAKKMALNQSIPAFRNCSLDDNPGTGRKLDQPQDFRTREGKVVEDWYDGDSVGQVNSFLEWENVKDEEGRYEIIVFLSKEAPKESCMVDLTPRRLQRFRTKEGGRFSWSNASLKEGKEIQRGVVIADEVGLVTLEKVLVSKGRNRVAMSAAQ